MKPYRVARMPQVVKQMRNLAKKAALLGIKAELIAAFESLDEQLQSSPLALGNPVHRTKKQGGVVCVGVIEPISVWTPVVTNVSTDPLSGERAIKIDIDRGLVVCGETICAPQLTSLVSLLIGEMVIA